ncbi:MAG: acyloxyacyl hydrolase [Pseudomonadota bacterium]
MKRTMLAASMTLVAPTAGAEILDSVRLGVMAHNIEVTDGKNANKEDGVNINGEVRFAALDALSWIGSPHPYVMGSVNTDGETSYGGFGVEWDFEFAPGWRIEPGVGYVIHDGETKNPLPLGSAERTQFGEDNLLLGSEDLFRTSLALTRDINERWAVQVIFEHLSHGQILGNGRNQGLDELGIRAVYRFGD